MTLGKASQQCDLFDPVTPVLRRDVAGEFDLRVPVSWIGTGCSRTRCSPTCSPRSGRRSVPPSVVAAVMVLQRLEGLSDREAVDRFTFDARWRYAAGVGGWDGAGAVGFAHTVLVDMRERLRRSDGPDRVFEVALAAAGQAGLLGRRRVLDSTPLYDAVATMDTITLIRSAIRGLLTAADTGLAAELRALLTSGDDYRSPGKPAMTGTTRPPGPLWSIPGPVTVTPCWRGCTAGRCPIRSPKERGCWLPSWVRTSKRRTRATVRAAAARCGSRGGLPGPDHLHGGSAGPARA